jgi:fructose-1,6-bisphosphatase
VEKALDENIDIEFQSDYFEKEPSRVLVKSTDVGKQILDAIGDLEMLLSAYRSGELTPKF